MDYSPALSGKVVDGLPIWSDAAGQLSGISYSNSTFLPSAMSLSSLAGNLTTVLAGGLYPERQADVLSSYTGLENASRADFDKPYFGDMFTTLNEFYSPIHGYLSLLVCVFGIFANVLNIVVLTR